MAFQVQPPQSNHILELQQAWYRIGRSLDETFDNTGIGNVLFVDAVDGNDSTAVRGSITHSYSTIQTALDEAQGGDTVYVGPGTWTEDVVWPQTENVTLKGFGRDATTITNATAAEPTVSIAPTGADILGVVIQDITVLNTGTGDAIHADAATDSQTDSFDALRIERVSTQAASGQDIRLETGNLLFMRDVDAEGGVVVNEFGRAIYEGIEADYMTIRYAADQVTPSDGRGAHAAGNTLITNALTVQSLAWVAFGDECGAGSVVGALADDTDPAVYGIVDFRGRCTGSFAVTFGFENAALNPHVAVRADESIIGGALSIADSGGTGTERCVAHVRNAILEHTTANENQAGNLVDLDIRGTNFDQDSLSVAGDGAIDRTLWVQTIAAGNSPATAVNWANTGGNIPYVTAPEFVATESDTIGELPIAIVAKTTAAVTCEKTLDVEPHIVKAYLGGV